MEIGVSEAGSSHGRRGETHLSPGEMGAIPGQHMLMESHALKRWLRGCGWGGWGWVGSTRVFIFSRIEYAELEHRDWWRVAMVRVSRIDYCFKEKMKSVVI